MNQKMSSAQLKSIAKGQLLGKYPAVISAEVTVELLVGALSLLCTGLCDQTSAAGMVITYLVAFILEIMCGIFYVGLSRFYLNLICNRPYTISDIFHGFRFHADKAIAVRFFVVTMELIAFIPFFITAFFYYRTQMPAMFLCFCIFGALGGIAAIIIELHFSQVYYIMLDFPDYSTRQIIRTSKQIMRGNKFRLFYITVSLLPYYLLAVLSCGIALLWVVPFHKTTLANFYLDLMHREYEV